MRRSVLVALLATTCLVAIWCVASWAQVIDATPCQRSCRDQQSRCVSACGAQNNPVECGEQCEDEHEDCLEQCD